MRSLYPLLFATLLIIGWSQSSVSQWVRQYPLEKLEDVLDIDVSPDGHGFAVGNNDLLLRLDAVTKTWELLPGYGENWRFEAVDYLDGTDGNDAAVGGAGLLVTTNHGDTWTKIDGAPAGVHTIKMFSQDHLIAIGDEDAFVWKDNQWTDLHALAPATIRGAFILDEMHMWLYTANTNAAVLYTTNGGLQWNINTDMDDIDVVRFYDSLNGIATDGRDVYMTSNGGVNWVLTGDNALPNTVNDLTYGISRHILIGASINAEPALSIDSGKTWTALDPGLINQRSYSVVAVSDDEFWVGNDLSSVTYSINGGASWEERSGPDRNIIQDVFFINRSVGFAVGQKGMLLSTRNGGTDWEDISFGTRSHFALHGLTENSLWLGANQRILHSVDTGKTWTDALIVVGGNINDVLAISSQIILGASSSGIIYRSDDGGMTWDTVHNESGTQLKSLARIDDQRYMATGFNGVILRSADQGLTWQPVSVPEAGLQYEQAYFLDGTGWLVTSSFKKTMWSTTDAGDTWTPITLPVDRFWDGVYFISQDTGIVVGRSTNEGRAYITFTGGQTWSAGHVLSFPLFGVAGIPNPNGTAWIFGYGSDIEVLPYCDEFPAIADFTGNLFPCEGDTLQYSVSSQNADNFIWLLPTGWSVLGNSNNDTIRVVAGSNSGLVAVSASNACGETGQLSFSAGPILLPELFSISGDLNPCTGDVITYMVFENNAEDFLWILPADWTIMGNPNQSSVMVQVGTEAGFISVVGSNTCGTTEQVDFYVEPYPFPTINFISGDLTPCPGDTVGYEFTTSLENSYVWSNLMGLEDWTFLDPSSPFLLLAVAGHSSGSLQVSAVNECYSSLPFTLSLTPENAPDVVATFNTGTSVLSLSQTGSQYEWYFNGQVISGANGSTYTASQNGNYYAVVTYANGCKVVSNTVNVTTVATSDEEIESAIVYPVPANEKLYIHGLTGSFDYQIIDLTGRLVDEGRSVEAIILVSHLQQGYYLLKLKDGDNQFIAKFIRE